MRYWVWRVIMTAWLLWPAAYGSDFSGLIPGLKETKEAVLAVCYAAHPREKELYDLSIKLDMYKRIFGLDGEIEVNDGEFVLRLRQQGLAAWQRYQELKGPATQLRDVKILPDPCMQVRRAF